MQRDIKIHGVDFTIEFDPQTGEVEAYFVRGVDVTEIVRDFTKWTIHDLSERNFRRWADEYHAQMADEERAHRKAA